MGEKDAAHKLRSLGNAIRTRREAEEISLRKFALMIEMNYTYLYKIERGEGNPSIEILMKIAEGLNVPVRDLIDF